MFYVKNVPHWERALRILAGAAVAAMGFAVHHGALMDGTLIATGIFIGMTGFFGFCPMCAMVGRKLDKN